MFGFRTLDPDPAACAGAGRRGAHLPLRRARGPAADAGHLARTGERGPATSRAGSSTGCGCTRSTSARSSTSATASTWRCSSSSASRRASRSRPTSACARSSSEATAAGELMAQANTFAKRFDGSRYWPDRQWDLAIVLDNSAQRGDGLRRAARARLVVLRGGQLLRGDEEPDARRRAGVPRLLHRRRRRLARRRPRLHAARPGGPAGQAVLVGDRLRRRHPLPDRQRAAARRPRLTRRRSSSTNDDGSVDLLLRPDRAGRARARTGCRPSPAATGSPTSASTARSSPTSTAAGSSATSPRSRPAAPGPPGRSRRPHIPWRGTPRRASPGRPGACTARRGSAA